MLNVICCFLFYFSYFFSLFPWSAMQFRVCQLPQRVGVCACVYRCVCVYLCVLCAISICSEPTVAAAAAAAVALTCNMQHSHRVCESFSNYTHTLTHTCTHAPVVKRHFDLFSVRQQTPCWQQQRQRQRQQHFLFDLSCLSHYLCLCPWLLSPPLVLI